MERVGQQREVATVNDAFHDILPPTDKAMRKSLNGQWNLKVIKGSADGAEVPQADATWETIPVPGCWEAYGRSKPAYDRAEELTGYYRTSFTIPAEWKDLNIAIQLDGVLYGYDLWINGRWAGAWRSAYNTAVFDITPFVDRRRQEQQLAMKVITQFPGSDFDYNDDWAPTGIFRDVTLLAFPKTHIADLTIHTKNTGEVNVDTRIANSSRSTLVETEILDAQGRIVGQSHVDHPHLWTAETPYLYTLRTRLVEKGKTLQTFEHRFGFRELTIDGKRMLLNGKPFKMRGVTCHSTDPRTAKVVSDELTLKDMRLMKEASVNYIRTSHYPREPRFYELADSLGFYIVDEVPFGYGDKNLTDTAFYPVLQQRAQATIRRDKNHPSVLIWSIGNENPLTDICQQLGRYVKRELDSIRPICYPQVGSYFRRFNYDFPKVADIYTPHYPSTDQIGTFYQKAERPVIFTEYCHSLGISLEDHDRQWEAIERSPGIIGGSVWEWVDQGMPFTQSEARNDFYGYEERVFTSPTGGFEMYGNKGTDGLLYADRTPLPNYYELQHNYAIAAIADSILMSVGDRLDLHIRNRYDFIDLKDNVTFHWALTEGRDTVARGAFSPSCPPRQTTVYSLHTTALPTTTMLPMVLNVDVTDVQGHSLLHQGIRVNPRQDMAHYLTENLDRTTGDPMTRVQDGFLVRAGRKATMAEQLKVADQRLERYLIHTTPSGGQAGPLKAVIGSEPAGNAMRYRFTLTADTSNTFLSEAGIAFLLDKRIDRAQWIGNGPVPTYPGRFRAGQYGLWGMRQGDIYFEGNRRGVDVALLTDAEGNGLLMVCNNGNVSFEQTDRGIVLTCNAAVSGQGPKSRRTTFPVIARQTGTIAAEFYLYRVDAGHWPAVLRSIFNDPQSLPEANNHFLTQYDTYLMRYEDITAK